MANSYRYISAFSLQKIKLGQLSFIINSEASFLAPLLSAVAAGKFSLLNLRR